MSMMLEYGTLYIPPEVKEKRPPRFQKGHTPWNKGKKWGELFSEEQKKNMAKGWSNIMEHHGNPYADPHYRVPHAKTVIAVFADGSWQVYDTVSKASRALGCCRSHICRVCKDNLHFSWTRYKGENNDHKHKGIKFYYEFDDNWLTKIKQ